MNEIALTILHGELTMALTSLISMLSVSLTAYKLGHYIANCGLDFIPDAPHSSVGTAVVSVSATEHHTGKSAVEGATKVGVASSFVARASELQVKTVELRPSDPEAAVTATRDMGEREETLSCCSGEWTLELDSPCEPELERIPRLYIVGHVAIALLALGITITCVAWLAVACDVQGLLCMALAPFGALLRWLLSLYNPLTAPLPLFTLLANTLGCMAVVTGSVMADYATTTEAEHAMYLAFATGFGGCLSTVSTLIAELRSDKLGGLRIRGMYFLSTFFLAMLVFLPTYKMAADC
jgi:fluoride ion exporter CrcB/FEX